MKCAINTKKCKECSNYHYLSYATNSKTQKKIFYHNSLELKYFQVTKETIFENEFIAVLMSDIMFKQTSFAGFCDAYNFLYANNLNDIRHKLQPHRLADVFYCYELIKFYNENGIDHNIEGMLLKILIITNNKTFKMF